MWMLVQTQVNDKNVPEFESLMVSGVNYISHYL